MVKIQELHEAANAMRESRNYTKKKQFLDYILNNLKEYVQNSSLSGELKEEILNTNIFSSEITQSMMDTLNIGATEPLSITSDVTKNDKEGIFLYNDGTSNSCLITREHKIDSLRETREEITVALNENNQYEKTTINMVHVSDERAVLNGEMANTLYKVKSQGKEYKVYKESKSLLNKEENIISKNEQIADAIIAQMEQGIDAFNDNANMVQTNNRTKGNVSALTLGIISTAVTVGIIVGFILSH